MKKEKKPVRPSGYLGIETIFKFRTLRCAFWLLAIVMAFIFLIMFDPHNVFRNTFFPFIPDYNLISDILIKLRLRNFNLFVESWYIIGCILIVVFIGVLTSLFSGSIKRLSLRPQTKRSTVVAYVIFYFVFCIALAVGAIFVFIRLGAFTHFNHPIKQVLTWVARDMGIFALFFVISGVLLIALFFLIQALSMIFGFIVNRSKRFDEVIKISERRRTNNNPAAISAVGFGVGASEKGSDERPASELFPALVDVDNENKANPQVATVSSELSLEEFALQFQSFAINKHQIYYELPLIRSFVASMAVSKLIILEGLSGTGKSMLPRMFSEFTHSNKFFAPVQATWRDKTDLLGFYSEFTKTFKTTDFLLNLYKSSYSDKVNFMVLDEMNISRIEYYFADFLSILEYPPEDWKVKVYDPQLDQELPDHLQKGYIQVPTNTWFVGTANTDDSTFTITDKVYDRAMVIDFKEKFAPIESTYTSDDIQISADDLYKMFEQAKADPDLCLNEDDLNKFLKICDFMRDVFDIRFGNRIMVQIEGFVPVYVAMGGTKVAALDQIFATKVLRKLVGAYDDFIKDELGNLTKLITDTYGEGAFVESERLIQKIVKRLV